MHFLLTLLMKRGGYKLTTLIASDNSGLLSGSEIIKNDDVLPVKDFTRNHSLFIPNPN